MIVLPIFTHLPPLAHLLAMGPDPGVLCTIDAALASPECHNYGVGRALVIIVTLCDPRKCDRSRRSLRKRLWLCLTEVAAFEPDGHTTRGTIPSCTLLPLAARWTNSTAHISTVASPNQEVFAHPCRGDSAI